MKKVNIFIIKTPFQFLNAIRFKEQNLNENLNFLIIVTQNKNSYDRITQICNSEDWDLIFNLGIQLASIKFKYLSKLILKYNALKMDFTWVTKLSEIKKNYSIDNIISGNYFEPIFQISTNNCLYNSLVIVDDGTATFRILKEREKELDQEVSFFFEKKYVIYNILLRIKKKPIKSISFFSKYNFTPHKSDNYILNKTTEEDLLIKSIEDTVFIIGGPYVSKNMIPKNKYIEILKKIVHTYPAKHFYYIPHRQENKNDKSLVSKYMTIIEPNEPIELYFKKTDILPKWIIGFYSSALINLSTSYGSLAIEFVAIKTNFNLSPKDNDVIQEIYFKFANEYGILVKDF